MSASRRRGYFSVYLLFFLVLRRLLEAGEADVILLDTVCRCLNASATASGTLCDPANARAILTLAADLPLRAQRGAFDPGAFIFSEPYYKESPPKHSRVVLHIAPYLPNRHDHPDLLDPYVPVSLWQLSRSLQRTHILLCDVLSKRLELVSDATLLLRSAASSLRHAAHMRDLSSLMKDEEHSKLLLTFILKAAEVIWNEPRPVARRTKNFYATGRTRRETQAELFDTNVDIWLAAVSQAALEFQRAGIIMPPASNEIFEQLLSLGEVWLTEATNWLDNQAPDGQLSPGDQSILQRIDRFVASGFVRAFESLALSCNVGVDNDIIAREKRLRRRSALLFTLAWHDFHRGLLPSSEASLALVASTWTLVDRGVIAVLVSRTLLDGNEQTFFIARIMRRRRALLLDLVNATLPAGYDVQSRSPFSGNAFLFIAHKTSPSQSPRVSSKEKPAPLLWNRAALELDAVVRVYDALQVCEVCLSGPLLSRIAHACSTNFIQPCLDAYKENELSPLVWYQKVVIGALHDPQRFKVICAPKVSTAAAPRVLTTAQLSLVAERLAAEGEGDMQRGGALHYSTLQEVQRFIRTHGPRALLALLDAMTPSRVASRGLTVSPLLQIYNRSRGSFPRRVAGDFMKTSSSSATPPSIDDDLNMDEGHVAVSQSVEVRAVAPSALAASFGEDFFACNTSDESDSDRPASEVEQPLDIDVLVSTEAGSPDIQRTIFESLLVHHPISCTIDLAGVFPLVQLQGKDIAGIEASLLQLAESNRRRIGVDAAIRARALEATSILLDRHRQILGCLVKIILDIEALEESSDTHKAATASLPVVKKAPASQVASRAVLG